MAYSLVGEIISLLSDLVSEKTAEQVWGTAIKQVSGLQDVSTNCRTTHGNDGSSVAQ